MYDKNLDTFLITAECGSFTKAASRLFISHTAVIKQINTLESYFGVKLFHRSHQGITLTAAGQVLVDKTKEIQNFSVQALQAVQDAHFASPVTIKVGTSLFYPCHIFLDLWHKVSDSCPQYNLKIIPIDNDSQRLNELNDSYDFLVGPYDTTSIGKEIIFFPISKYRFCLTMPRKHPLAKKKSLSFSDLENHSIMIMTQGNSKINDQIRAELQTNYPKVLIEDISPHYDLETFNRCNEQGSILLSLECWENVHPALVSTPLHEDYSLPYGILASKNLKTETDEFIKAIQDTLSQ